jgi:hypothetical protein
MHDATCIIRIMKYIHKLLFSSCLLFLVCFSWGGGGGGGMGFHSACKPKTWVSLCSGVANNVILNKQMLMKLYKQAKILVTL